MKIGFLTLLGCSLLSVSFSLLGPDWTYDEHAEKPLGEKDMGGWTASVYTKEQQMRLGIDEFGKQISSLEEEEVDENTVGCCFDHGFGAMMKPCCFTNHQGSKRSECDTESRMGGKRAWDSRECEVLKQVQGISEEDRSDREEGCCYRQGYGKDHEPCCFENHRDTYEHDCEIQVRMGGRTIWDERSCEEVKSEQQSGTPPENSSSSSSLWDLLPGILPINLTAHGFV